MKPAKPCDKNSQCLRWPPTYTGHFPLQGGCNNRSSSQHTVPNLQQDNRWEREEAFADSGSSLEMSSSSDSLPLAELWLEAAHQYERQNAGSSGSCHALANQTVLHLRARELCSPPPVWWQGNLCQQRIKAQTTL